MAGCRGLVPGGNCPSVFDTRFLNQYVLMIYLIFCGTHILRTCIEQYKNMKLTGICIRILTELPASFNFQTKDLSGKSAVLSMRFLTKEAAAHRHCRSALHYTLTSVREIWISTSSSISSVWQQPKSSALVQCSPIHFVSELILTQRAVQLVCNVSNKLQTVFLSRKHFYTAPNLSISMPFHPLNQYTSFSLTLQTYLRTQ